jgi:multidrug resistance protein, MATE family
MGGSNPIPTGGGPSNRDFVATLASSFRSTASMAEQVLAKDLAECSDTGDCVEDEVVETYSDCSDENPGPTLYRRPSGVAFGTARPILGPQLTEPVLTPVEKKQSRDAERSLLRDNHVLPPKHPQVADESRPRKLYKRFFSTKVPRKPQDEETPHICVQPPGENTPLLGDGSGASFSNHHHHEHLNEQWDAALAAGNIRTTWQREAKTITTYAAPLIVTFLLQYSISVTSIFAVGRIGKEELGSVSCKLIFSLSSKRKVATYALSLFKQ